MSDVNNSEAGAMTRSLLAPSLTQMIAGALVAVLLAVGTYVWTVRGSYQRLYEAYLEAEAFEAILAQDPLVPPGVAASIEEAAVEAGGVNERVLVRALQILGMAESDETLVEIREASQGDDANAHELGLIYRALVKDDEQPERATPNLVASGSRPEGTAGSVEALAQLAFAAGNKGGSAQTNEEYREGTARILAALLAGQPGFRERYRVEMGSLDVDQIRAGYGPDLSLLAGWNFTSEPLIRQEQLLRLLFSQLQVNEEEGNALKLLDQDVGSGRPLQLRRLAEFSAALVDQLHADTKVKRSRQVIAVFQGYEQLCLWLAVYLILAVLGLRHWNRLRASREGKLVGRLIGNVIPAYSPESVLEAMPWVARFEIVNGAQHILRDTSISSVEIAAIRDKASFDDHRLRKAATPGADSKMRGSVGVGRTFTLGGLADSFLMICAQELLRKKERSNGNALERFAELTNRLNADSRWFLKWLSRAMPAIGFIGTVRGISAALSSADSIVRQSSASGQAAAITDVAGTLGIAFTTTLIALLFGLATSLLVDSQASRERALVGRLEGALLPLIEPSLVQSRVSDASRSTNDGERDEGEKEESANA